MWPKGSLAEAHIERSKSTKEITKILVKTKLLALVSDELRHILGNDTTRRGMFELFDLFQHKALNKRLFHILTENLLMNLFQMPKLQLTNFQAHTPPIFPHASIVLTSSQSNLLLQQQLLSNPLKQLIRLHLTKSAKVKSEWKTNSLTRKSADGKRLDTDVAKMANHRRSISTSQSAFSLSTPLGGAINTATSVSQSLLVMTKQQSLLSGNNKAAFTLVDSTPVPNTEHKSPDGQKSESNMTRSKSLFNEIQC